MPDNKPNSASKAMNQTVDSTVTTAKTAADAATSMNRTAAGAANRMGETARSAATDMGRTAMESGAAGMGEVSRMFSDMKFPAMPDMETFLSAQRRNMEVLTQANRVALEGAQTVARRHMEIMQQTMSEMTEGMRQMASPDSPQARAAKQAEMLKAAYERAVAHMRELADLIQRANGEALSLLNQRFAEAMDEVKALAEKSGRPSAG